MTWKIYRLEGGLGDHGTRWDALNEVLFAANPYFDSLFVGPLIRHFGTGAERLCVHGDDGDTDGMLIVTPRRKGLWSLFVPPQAQIAPILCADATNLRKLLPRLGLGTLGLECLCQDPGATPLAQSLTLPTQVKNHARTINVDLSTTFEAYWSGRSSNLRKSVGRRARRAKDEGIELRLQCIENADEMAGAVERFSALEAAGWKGGLGTAVNMRESQGKFYVDVMTGFAKAGRASVYELYFNEDLAATQLAIASARMLVFLKTSYDERKANLAPGRLLSQLVLEREFMRQRAKTVEFYTHASDEQAAWATGERWVQHHLVLRNAVVAKAYELKERLRL
jgi:CelD/BcsL family acetyltransferase involved in cellulose biosynthesis